MRCLVMVLSAADVVRIVHTVLEWLLWWSALAPASVHRLPALADRTTSLLRLSPLSRTALPNRSNCWRCQDALLPVASCEWPTPVDTMALPPYTFLVACMKAPGNSGALRCRHVRTPLIYPPEEKIILLGHFICALLSSTVLL